MNTFTQKAPFNSLQLFYDPSILSASPWSVMQYPILRQDHAKICFPLKQNVSRKILVFIQYFRSRMGLHSLKTNFTLGTSIASELLRQCHSPLRSSHLGRFEHTCMSIYLFKSRFKTSQTVGRWCWWLESSRCISFLAGRDGDESAHSSSPAWDPVSCYVGSAHLFKYHGRSRGTLWDPEWLLIGSNSSRKPPTLHPVLIDPWESRK